MFAGARMTDLPVAMNIYYQKGITELAGVHDDV
jgi:hypothetical protein